MATVLYFYNIKEVSFIWRFHLCPLYRSSTHPSTFALSNAHSLYWSSLPLPVSVKITLRDLKSCQMTPVFFNTFVNVDKYLDYEQRDPIASVKEEGAEGVELSDWDKYASEQYELLLQEEQYEQENNE